MDMPRDGTPERVPIIAVADTMRRRAGHLLNEPANLEWLDVPVNERVFWYELAVAGLGEWIHQMHQAQRPRP